MSRRGRRGNGQVRQAQTTEETEDNEPEIVVIDESGNELADDGTIAVAVAADDAAEDTSDGESDAGDPYENLKRQFDELKASKETDARRLREYEQKQNADAQDHQATQKALLEHALASAQGELKAAKAQFKEAMAAGDFDAASEAQGAIAAAQLDARQYELAKDNFDNQIEAEKVRPRHRQLSKDEQIDAYMQQFTPATKAWATKHKDDLFKSAARTNQAVALHWAAVNDNVTPDTPEYFSYIEKGLGIKPDAARTQRTQQEKRPAMVSAPVGRGGGSGNGSRQEFQLTKEMREMASSLGMSVTKYAKYMDDLQKKSNDPNWRGPRLSQYDGQQKG